MNIYNRLLIYVFLIPALIFLWPGCKDKQSSTQEVVPPENKQTNAIEMSADDSMKTILCFGNSLTAGYGLEEDEAWPALLKERLDSLGYNYDVINAGLSGETSSGGLNRLDWVLNRPVDIFILELGANDMLRGLDVSNTRENLDKIIDLAKSKNEKLSVLIAGMMSPPNMGPDYEKAFNKIYPDLAKKHDAALIPFFLNNVAAVDTLNLPDGKHPNAEGQKVVLENVWASLNELLVRPE
jgi:acyl-CoA thioesterase-1